MHESALRAQKNLTQVQIGRQFGRLVDNNGNYEPGNVRWATGSEQNRNQRRSRPAAA